MSTAGARYQRRVPKGYCDDRFEYSEPSNTPKPALSCGFWCCASSARFAYIVQPALESNSSLAPTLAVQNKEIVPAPFTFNPISCFCQQKKVPSFAP